MHGPVTENVAVSPDVADAVGVYVPPAMPVAGWGGVNATVWFAFATMKPAVVTDNVIFVVLSNTEIVNVELFAHAVSILAPVNVMTPVLEL